jgi:hypothetical protein
MRLGRDARGISVGLADTIIAGPSLKRFAIIIGAPLTNRVTLDFGKPAVLDNGITLYPGGPPFLLLYDHIGNAIREEIHAITTAGAQSIGVVDIGWT